MMDLFDSTGRRLSLGRKIGSGGEGDVYDVPALGPGKVAKIYRGPVSREKQDKLRSMVQSGDESLKKVAAWPLATLHLSAGGTLRGFVMPRLTSEPVHHVYGPSHRKQRLPDKDWAFLVNAARNVAAAFDVIHSHGHVIGDVNQNLVYVAGNSMVRLIDCDSFQVSCGGRHYLCEVGVPHFTPPELQSTTMFSHVRRTMNHDRFGLALLLFHLLLMGRHPFSGVYAGAGDLLIEEAIAQFRYAFGQDAASRKMAPPPRSVTPGILTRTLAEYFERAFTEPGAQPEGRPTAREWVAALDALKGQLRTCGQEPMHKYFGALPACPWCEHVQKSGLYFFLSLLSSPGARSRFNPAKVWARVMAVTSPGAAPALSLAGAHVQPRPLPPAFKQARQIRFLKLAIASLLVTVCCEVWYLYSWLIAAIGIIVFVAIKNVTQFFDVAGYATERKTRESALKVAQNGLEAVMHQWKLDAGDGRFQDTLADLARVRTEHAEWVNQLAQARLELQRTRRTLQLNRFLSRYFLKDSWIRIPGLGPGRKATLASHGIETAADIDCNGLNVMQIRGFKLKLAGELVDWRKTLERNFVYDASKGIDPADMAAVNQRFAPKRTQLEGRLLAGPELLCQVRGQILQRRSQLLPLIQAAARQVEQAQADVSLMK